MVKNPNTELILAVRKQDLKAVKSALKKGADPNTHDLVDSEEYKGVDKVRNYSEPLFLIALWKGNFKIAQLLLDNGADVNNMSELEQDFAQFSDTPSWGLVADSTPLILACKKNRSDIVKFLIKNGADVNKRDASNMTPLQHALELGYHDIAELLKSKGAKA